LLASYLAATAAGCKRNAPPPSNDTQAPAVVTPTPVKVSPTAPLNPTAPNPTVVRISAFQDGHLQVDGQTLSYDDVYTLLKGLDPDKSLLWYYREASSEPPHPTVQRLVKAINDLGLSISLSTQPDFSDYIGTDKKSHPRVWHPN
jgi:hypothetical protein